jgi:prepilin peptidase CpaA
MDAFPLLAFTLPTVPPVAWWVWTVLLAACVVATATDLRSMRIPNWLTLPMLVAGITRGGLVGGLAGTGDAVAGAVFAGFVFIGAYIFAGGGAGDAKLMMALGAWLGLDPSVVLVMTVTLSGFLLAMYFTVARGGLRDVPLMIYHGLLLNRVGFANLLAGRGGASAALRTEDQTPRKRPKHWFPYAPAILVGTALACWYCSVFVRKA